MSKGTEVRACAAKVVQHTIFGGRNLSTMLHPLQDQHSVADCRLITEIASGVVRWFWRLEEILKNLLRKPLRRKDRDVYCLLLVGIYQLQSMRVPHYAAVSSTVEAVQLLNKSWARSLVNAVLRRYLSEPAKFDADASSLQSQYSHPFWMIEIIKQDWPQLWSEVLVANNEKPVMTLRVNLAKLDLEQYLERLEQNGIEATPDPSTPTAIKLARRVDVNILPGFGQGVVSVQGLASQWVVPSMELADGQRVLDACSAPGGKLLHILEAAPQLAEVVAIDIAKARTGEIVDNLARAGSTATVMTADASRPDDWWDGKPFDRILIDAPCSAFGVISKHPDIKHHRKPDDIERLVLQQSRLIDALLPLLSNNGKLLYTTCSILARENDDQIERALQRHRVVCDSLPATCGRATRFGRQRLPGPAGCDGFYYSRLGTRA